MAFLEDNASFGTPAQQSTRKIEPYKLPFDELFKVQQAKTQKDEIKKKDAEKLAEMIKVDNSGLLEGHTILTNQKIKEFSDYVAKLQDEYDLTTDPVAKSMILNKQQQLVNEITNYKQRKAVFDAIDKDVRAGKIIRNKRDLDLYNYYKNQAINPETRELSEDFVERDKEYWDTLYGGSLEKGNASPLLHDNIVSTLGSFVTDEGWYDYDEETKELINRDRGSGGTKRTNITTHIDAFLKNNSDASIQFKDAYDQYAKSTNNPLDIYAWSATLIKDMLNDSYSNKSSLASPAQDKEEEEIPTVESPFQDAENIKTTAEGEFFDKSTGFWQNFNIDIPVLSGLKQNFQNWFTADIPLEDGRYNIKLNESEVYSLGAGKDGKILNTDKNAPDIEIDLGVEPTVKSVPYWGSVSDIEKFYSKIEGSEEEKKAALAYYKMKLKDREGALAYYADDEELASGAVMKSNYNKMVFNDNGQAALVVKDDKGKEFRIPVNPKLSMIGKKINSTTDDEPIIVPISAIGTKGATLDKIGKKELNPTVRKINDSLSLYQAEGTNMIQSDNGKKIFITLASDFQKRKFDEPVNLEKVYKALQKGSHYYSDNPDIVEKNNGVYDGNVFLNETEQQIYIQMSRDLRSFDDLSETSNMIKQAEDAKNKRGLAE